MVEHSEPHLILYQLFNVAVIVVAFILIFRKKAGAFFKNRREQYLESSCRTEKLLQSIHQQKKLLEDQIRQVEHDDQHVMQNAEVGAKKNTFTICLK